MNDNISGLERTGLGCRIGGHFLGVIMYADDILLLSPTVNGLQGMLDACTDLFNKKLLEFNVKKSSSFIIGKASKYTIQSFVLQGSEIARLDSFKYLGINFEVEKSLHIETGSVKRKFYAASNAILSKTRGLDELSRLSLLESNCLPLLTYAIPSMNINSKQINELNIAWNNIYRCIFGFHSWESVRIFIAGLGKLDFTHIWFKSCISFFKRNLISSHIILRFLTNRHLFCRLDQLCRIIDIDLGVNDVTDKNCNELFNLISNSFIEKNLYN